VGMTMTPRVDFAIYHVLYHIDCTVKLLELDEASSDRRSWAIKLSSH